MNQIKRVRRQIITASTLLIIATLVNSAPPPSEVHQAIEGDLKLPIGNQEIVGAGEKIYGSYCSGCHGGQGRGGRGPCVTCGSHPKSGHTNGGIYATIVAGLPMTKMGAFGGALDSDQILSVVTYLRWEEGKRIALGEITAPVLKKQEPMEFPSN